MGAPLTAWDVLKARGMSLRSILKGWVGEQITCLGMWMFLDKRIYRRVQGVILPTTRGTTQIDHVLVSPFGVFVIETKNMKGWIFGRENDEKWTQVLFGRKYRFQNPLRQNYRHTKCLAEFLKLEHSLFHSIVFFIGDCRFKTPMPANVMSSGLASYIKSFRQPRLGSDRISAIDSTLKASKVNPDLSLRVHLASLKSRHGSTTACPRCGGHLEQKVARRGRSPGHSFLGCSRYPACEFTRDLA